MNKQTDVLIIGGGFAGVTIAQKLAKSGIDTILIDKKNYFEVTFAMLRNITNPQKVGNTPRKMYNDFINGVFIQGNVESMNDKEVKLSNGNTISFKSAVISTGSRYPTLPLTKSNSKFDYEERNKEILKEHKSLKSADSVLIIGGGVVGVEFAGEIASAFPEKKITLAHGTDNLLDNFKPKMQQTALEQLTNRGVNVKFNRRFEKDGDIYRCKNSNETINADIVYVCIGMVPNTEFIRAEMPNILDEKGLVKVDSYMKVEGFDNIFALGDCSNLDNSNKNGYVATVQGGMLAKNLINVVKGKKNNSYKKQPVFVVTTTGTDTGVAQLPFGVSTLKLIINLKQKDLGVSNMYKTFDTEPDKLK
ncbi:MAG: FAD-dependent oxidoreductase [Spirochaetaceae bacterium]